MVHNRWVCSYINIRSSSVNLHFSYTQTVYNFPITAQFSFTAQQFTKTKNLYGCLTSQVVLGSMHWCSMMPCQLHDKTSQDPNWWPTRQTCGSFLLSKSDHPYVTVRCYVGVPLAWSSSLSPQWEVSCGLETRHSLHLLTIQVPAAIWQKVDSTVSENSSLKTP